MQNIKLMKPSINLFDISFHTSTEPRTHFAFEMLLHENQVLAPKQLTRLLSVVVRTEANLIIQLYFLRSGCLVAVMFFLVESRNFKARAKRC